MSGTELGTSHAGPGVCIAWADIAARDPRPWTAYLRAFGFNEDPGETGDGPAVFRLGRARVQVTGAPHPGSPAGRHLARHGDGVWDIGLSVPDLGQALVFLRSAGGQAGGPERRRLPGYGWADTAAAYMPGAGLRHTLVEGWPPPAAGEHALDHIALAVPYSTADKLAAAYGAAFGLAWTPTPDVVVGPEGLVSGVLDGPGLTIVLVSQDPARQAGQVDAFLAANGGPGVQHLAVAVPDIAAAVRDAGSRGARFLSVPGAYYDALADRLPGTPRQVRELRPLGILADRDAYGELLQVFTARPAEPSEMFFELVERRGSRGFGTQNIRHLYAARQADEAARAGTGSAA